MLKMEIFLPLSENKHQKQQILLDTLKKHVWPYSTYIQRILCIGILNLRIF